MTTQEIIEAAQAPGGERYTATHDIHLSEDGEIARSGSENARFVLVGKGGTIPMTLARQLGLQSEAKMVAPAENKAVKAPEHK